VKNLQVLSAAGRLCRRRLLHVSPDELGIDKRGFHPGTRESREQRERISAAVLFGYQAGVEHCSDHDRLARRLSECSSEDAGFAFEGAATALALLDGLDPFSRRDRVRSFLAGPAESFSPLVSVGVGMAVGRLPWLRWRAGAVSARFDWHQRWLILDGFGFHEAYFNWKRVHTGAVPLGVRGYGARAFDQGVGRGVWFVEGCDAVRVASAIAGFPTVRQADLWSGAGLACAYAGGADDDEVSRVFEASGRHQAPFAQGAAFAARARQLAGNPARHTDTVCRIACQMSAADAAAAVSHAEAALSDAGDESSYEVVRRRVQAVCSHTAM